MPAHQHDPAHWTRVNVGMTSPLWLPFLTAAAAGAAWWTYASWSRSVWGAAISTGAELPLQPHAEPAREPAASEPRLEAGARSAPDRETAGAPPASRTPSSRNEDRADAIDAAYAANLGPVPKPAAKARKAAKKSSR